MYSEKPSASAWSASVLARKLKHTLIQGAAAVLMNANISGFWKGKIYTGGSKHLCLPVLNCYSCPGALGACPIGSLQASAGCSPYGISCYVLGLLALMGVLFGRLFCGLLCPFGFFQDLLHRVPLPKLKIPRRPDRIMRFGKHLVLIFLVLLLPLMMADPYGSTVPYFCKYLCPAGTLEGGIPLITANPPLQAAVGWLFAWKLLVLVAVALLSMILYRPFCKYLCPLGAFYGLFNRFSFYRYYIDPGRCTDCGVCSRACPMDVSPAKTPNHVECIRCGLCGDKCPQTAIRTGRMHQMRCKEGNHE